MSHVTPLSLSKNALSIVASCSASSSQCFQVFIVTPDVQREVYSLPLQPKQPLCQYLLSQSYGYIIYNIPKLFFEFHVMDVGFIMALLQWDYSYRHHLIIQELVLETSLVPWDLYDSMIYSLTLNIVSHHWPLIDRFHWVFNIKSSIHIRGIVLEYLGNHWR